MRLEARKLRGPHRFGVGEPALQLRHGAVFQRIDANARVELGMGLLDESALLQLPQMPAHRRRRQAERVREFARPTRPLASSHSSGVILFSVTPKVQIWPSGSRAR